MQTTVIEDTTPSPIEPETFLNNDYTPVRHTSPTKTKSTACVIL